MAFPLGTLVRMNTVLYPELENQERNTYTQKIIESRNRPYTGFGWSNNDRKEAFERHNRMIIQKENDLGLKYHSIGTITDNFPNGYGVRWGSPDNTFCSDGILRSGFVHEVIHPDKLMRVPIAPVAAFNARYNTPTLFAPFVGGKRNRGKRTCKCKNLKKHVR